jgi:hypothetical protein
MKKLEAERIFRAYVERQKSRDGSGHVSHLANCGCPEESRDDIALLDQAVSVLPLETQRRIWQS